MTRRSRRIIVAAALFVLPFAACAPAQPRAGQELVPERGGSVVRPPTIAPTNDLLRQLRVPDGFTVTVFAQNLGKPRMIAVAPDGTAYVTRRDAGDVVALRDADGDGQADAAITAARLPDVHGIAIHDGTMYLATVQEVYRAPMQPDGSIGEPQRIIAGLPPGGRHPNRTLAVGPDQRLYLTVGSTCNCCMEPDERSATVLVSDLDGRNLLIFAKGLRNTLGIDFHPQTGQMWGMDNGSDWLGDGVPPEELNLIEDGKHYGWPIVNGDGHVTQLPQYPRGVDPQQWLAETVPMVLGYTPHTAPLQLEMYTGDAFPAEYRGDAFVCLHGSWNREPPAGYEVVRVDFDEQGRPRSIESFVSGFLVQRNNGWAVFGRPAGIAQTPDGALLMSDDENGVIYRIGYRGE